MMENPFAGMFSVDPNMTPQQIAEKRARLAAMMPQFGNARYVGQGLGQLATGIAMGAQNRRLDKVEGTNQQAANDMFSRIFGARDTGAATSGPMSASSGPMSVLGMRQDTPITQGPIEGAPDPNSPQGLGLDAVSAIGQTSPYSNAIASIESAGSGGYQAVGPETGKGRAYGKYQVMDFNIPAWTKKHTGVSMTPEAFLASPGAQEAVFNGEFGGYVEKYGNPQDAASVWFSGRPLAGNNSSDGGNTVPQYVEKFNAALGAQPATAPPQIPMDQLYSALSSPWITPEQKAVITDLIGQNTQNADPMRAMELEKSQIELDQMRNPQADPMAAIKLAQAELDLSQDRTGAGADLPAGFAALDMQARASGYEQGTPEYQDWMRNGGGAPASFTALDMQAKASGYEQGTPEYQRFMASRGSYERANDATLGQGAAEAVIAAPAQISNGQIALQGIDEIRSHEGIDVGTGISSYGNAIRGTKGYAFETRVKQLAGGAFLTAIQQLQGMGALSNAEGQTATAALARLQTGLSRTEFEDALADYEAIVKGGVSRAQAKISGQPPGIDADPLGLN